MIAIECDSCRALQKPLEKPNFTWGELVLTTARVWGGGVGGECEDIDRVDNTFDHARV